jgi:hypothetical protein
VWGSEVRILSSRPIFFDYIQSLMRVLLATGLRFTPIRCPLVVHWWCGQSGTSGSMSGDISRYGG